MSSIQSLPSIQTNAYRRPASTLLCGGIEAVVLLMVVVSPWIFAGVHPLEQLFLHACVALLLLLWAVRMVVEGKLLWNPCGVSLGLAAFFLMGIVQTLPLPAGTLRLLSPATADLYAELRPAQPEVPRDAHGEAQAARLSSLSVSPNSTGAILLQLAAVLALFGAVRVHLAAPPALLRLAVVAVANGVLLSLLAMGQFFSSPGNFVYWTFESEGNVFGPFICRNHFAYFINLSIGLALGLLFYARRSQASTRRGPAPSLGESLQEMLQEPVILWLASALALMGAGLLCSLSRGGVLACLAGLLVCAALKLWYSRGMTQHRYGLLLSLVGGAVVFGLCYEYAGKRLATIWQSNILEEARGPVWSRVATLVPKFPIFGTGLGTFRYVEPLTRQPADLSGILHEHVHNDYLEVLIEGGIINLGISLAIIAVLMVTGIRTYRLLRNVPEGGLVLGCIFGLTAVMVHGVGDFGMAIPAVVVLTTVVAALLLNMSDWARGVPVSPLAPGKGLEMTSQGSGAGLAGIPVVAAGVLTLVCVAFYLLDSAWRAERAESYRLAAWHANEATLDRDNNKKVAYYDAAVAYAPGSPVLQVALAEAYRHRYEAKKNRLWIALATGVAGAADEPLAGLGSFVLAQRMIPLAPGQSKPDEDLDHAAHHFLLARGLCPLLVKPYLFLAAYPEVLASGDRSEKYFERACLLDPGNPKVWYALGDQELRAGHPERAWACWRRSLQCSDTCLPEIMHYAAGRLSTDELIRQVLPEDPGFLFHTASRMKKAGQPDDAIRAIDASALALLQKQGAPAGANLLLQARLQARLRMIPAASESFRQVIAQDPNHLGTRLEYSRFLQETGHLSAAREELNTALVLQPSNGEAKSLLEAVQRAWVQNGQRDHPPATVKPLELHGANMADVKLATVFIVNPTAKVEGSGVLISPNGFILTAAHVVKGAKSVEVSIFPLDGPPEHYRNVAVFASREKNNQDLALLLISGYSVKEVALPIAAKPAPDKPIPALSAGCVKGRPEVRNASILRSVEVTTKGEPIPARYWMIEQPPRKGESGGPLVNMQGQLLGICSRESGDEGYYCHLDEIHRFLEASGLEKMLPNHR